MKLFSIQFYVHLYSGREHRLSRVNQLSLKIWNPLNFKSPTATDISILYFDKWFKEERNFCTVGSTLLNCWTEAEMPGNCKLLKERFDVEDQAFLRLIVAIDETWIRDFELELNSQFNKWRTTGSPRPKKFWQVQSKVEQMIYLFIFNSQENTKS